MAPTPPSAPDSSSAPTKSRLSLRLPPPRSHMAPLTEADIDSVFSTFIEHHALMTDLHDVLMSSVPDEDREEAIEAFANATVRLVFPLASLN